MPTSLIGVPPDVAQLREEIFNISHGQPISIERARFQQLWPYLDNIYVFKGTRKPTRGPTVTYLYRRLFRDKDHKTLVAPGDRQRNWASRSAIGCPCRLKKVDNGSGPIQLIRNSKQGHNHEYSALAWKITSGIKALAGQEVSKGYTASQVANVLKNPQNGNLQALHLAGGEALRSQDVRNAGL
ncbi:hypothetical protein PoHVEF18_003818 [Penicillium ochrochloron]